MKVSDLERRTPLWLALQDHLNTRLAELRAQNDGELSPDKTAALRGRIAEVKALLALGQEPRTLPPA